MRHIIQSRKLQNVRYDVRGPILVEAQRLESEGHKILKLNIVGFLSGPMPAQPLGWFKNEITSADAFKGLKYRTVGLAADLNRQLGAAVTILAGGEIVPALERGVIDGAEFNNPSSDLVLGFPDVSKTYMLQSYHQVGETFELIFNKAKYDALPAELKAIVKYAAEAESADMSWKALDRYSKDLEGLRGRGVQVIATPKPILEGVPKEAAEAAQSKLQDAGAKVSLA